MRKGPKGPPEPVERHETVRHLLSAVLREHTLSAKEMSVYLRIPEREVYEHLEHIRKSLGKSDYHLLVTPAQCERCGFVFRKRTRLAKPGKCPMCLCNLILPPLFSIRKVCL